MVGGDRGNLAATQWLTYWPATRPRSDYMKPALQRQDKRAPTSDLARHNPFFQRPNHAGLQFVAETFRTSANSFYFAGRLRAEFRFFEKGGYFALQKAIAGDSVWLSPI